MSRKRFKGRETLEKMWTRIETFGRLKRDIGVMVEKNRPIFESEDGEDVLGPPQVDVVICRGRSKLSFTAEEAKYLCDIVSEALPAAEKADKVCLEERKK